MTRYNLPPEDRGCSDDDTGDDTRFVSVGITAALILLVVVVILLVLWNLYGG